MPELRLHNSLTRRREVFVPIDPGHVRMYVCGPTVYDLAHVGNARPVVVYDVLARLSYDGLILFVREQGERDTAAAVTGFCGLLSTPIVEGGDSFRFTWGIGHSRYPDQGQSTQALIRTAMTVQRQIGTESPSIASSNRPRYALAS